MSNAVRKGPYRGSGSGIRCTLAAGLLAAAIMAVGAGVASAVVTHLPDGATVSYQPISGKAPAARRGLDPKTEFNAEHPLEYHDGPLMTSNDNYILLWAPKKGPKYAKKFTAGVAKYFKDLAHDSGLSTNVDSVAVQYGATYNSKYAGTIKDTDPYPANGCTAAPICLTASQLEAEIEHVVLSEGLPADLAHEYFLLTPEGVEDCFGAGSGGACSANAEENIAFCAYHSAISVPGGDIVWSNLPYVFEKNCDEFGHHPNGPSDSALLGGLSHEHNESITDPLPGSGWTDNTGQEIGDKCRTFEPESEFGTILGTAPDGSPYNQLINKHRYFYQQEWSNEGLECKQHA
jgi:hypothetical protein